MSGRPKREDEHSMNAVSEELLTIYEKRKPMIRDLARLSGLTCSSTSRRLARARKNRKLEEAMRQLRIGWMK